ncbi:FAD/NAD(P)-binding domain-containing protein [Exidia glandulosa HHB12029]|uniref:FAD/NAD(P)-binding domain-containing protein n=1 Tax=Exidia glandulosa HHB12029 TaxID=1314781 RepID=A0A165EIQ8_EXIGL|nr:FAD/NAD(P)-binding domain-containing protein [Exidia glandulosa HHB12029]
MTITDKTGEPLLHRAPPPDQKDPARPEIDRSVLRKILIDGAPQESIKWGHAFVSATPVEGTKEWEVVFENGEKTVVDLLVGADGARSRVRPLVSDTQIEYTGIGGAEVSFGPDVGAAHPELMARIGNGSVMALDGGSMLGAQLNGDGRVRTYAWTRLDEGTALRLPTEPAAAIAFILSHFEGWAPWLRQLVELADHRAIYPRPLYKLPTGHSWAHRAGVTLLGDAMSLMSPFAGQGANIAMYAGWQLGLALAGAGNETPEELDAAVAKYEEEVRKIYTASQELSEANLGRAMGPNGAKALIKWIEDMIAAAAVAGAKNAEQEVE